MHRHRFVMSRIYCGNLFNEISAFRINQFTSMTNKIAIRLMVLLQSNNLDCKRTTSQIVILFVMLVNLQMLPGTHGSFDGKG